MSSISTIFTMRIMNRISGPVDRTYIYCICTIFRDVIMFSNFAAGMSS